MKPEIDQQEDETCAELIHEAVADKQGIVQVLSLIHI